MGKELTIVVHGVGVKESGLSADLLSSSLNHITHKPTSSDDFYLVENRGETSAEDRQHNTFKCRVRRFQRKTDGKLDLVVADFYWGDLSRIGTGIFGLIYSFVTLVLGLSHPLRENAKSIYPECSFRKTLVFAFIKLIHGPIAAIHLVLIAGTLIHYFSGSFLFAPPQYTTFAVFIFSGVLAWLYLSKTRNNHYLAKLLGDWVLVATIVVIGFLFLDLVGLDLFEYLDCKLRMVLCKGAVNLHGCNASMTGIFKFGARLLAITPILWTAVVSIAVLILILDWALPHDAPSPSKNIIVPTMSLMMTLWYLMIGSAWGTLAKLGIVPQDAWIKNSYSIFLMIALGALIGLIAVAGYSFVKGRKSTKQFCEKNQNKSDFTKRSIDWLGKSDAQYLRTIVNERTLFYLQLLPVIFLVLIMIIGLNYILGGTPRVDNVVEWSETYVLDITALLAALAAALLVRFAKQFQAAMTILKDIVTYIDNFDSFSVLGGTDSGRREAYKSRERIQARLNSLVEQFVEDEDPDTIVFVTHSQGTVIAIDSIDNFGKQWIKRKGNVKNRAIKLITMGSPYTHIYNYYFAASFEAISDRKSLNTTSKQALILEWKNVFRLDDYVGTFIDSSNTIIKEHCVGSGGHTYYWTDSAVTRII